MSSYPLPDGVVLRTAGEADAPAVAALMNAVEEPLGGDSASSAADVLHYWNRSKDLKTLLAERNGRLIGSVETFANDDGCLNADIYIHPELRGSGVDLTLLRISEEDARDRGLRRIMNGILEADTEAAELLEREGYMPVRHFYRMTIELTRETPEPSWPEGFALQPFDLERDGGVVHAVIEEAFEHEWGHTPETPEEWHAHTLTRAGYAPELWIVVRDGDEIAAVTVCDAKRFGMAWIGTVAVRPAWRKRGLGLAMLHEAFDRFRERGETLAGLGVDAQNATGATRLYERAGMQRAWAAAVYEKELT
jgi:mycothiol synthase